MMRLVYQNWRKKQDSPLSTEGNEDFVKQRREPVGSPRRQCLSERNPRTQHQPPNFIPPLSRPRKASSPLPKTLLLVLFFTISPRLFEGWPSNKMRSTSSADRRLFAGMARLVFIALSTLTVIDAAQYDFDPERCDDLVVAGAGPGGLYSAWRLIDAGIVDPYRTCIFEQTHRLGESRTVHLIQTY